MEFMYYSKSTNGFYDLAVGERGIPEDAVSIARDYYALLLEGQSQGLQIVADAEGKPILQDRPAQTPEQAVRVLGLAAQMHLDTTAGERGYDSILSLCSYATSSVAKFAAEGQAGVEWRDAVWANATQTFDQVLAGTIPAPTAEELIAALPPIVWPD